MDESKKGADSSPQNNESRTKKVIDLETARAEVQKWVDGKRLKQSKLDDTDDNFEFLVSAVADGSLVLNEDLTFDHKLAFPIQNKEGQVTVDKLKYKHRLNPKLIKPHMKGVKAGDGDERLTRIICALTDKAPGVIDSLDTSDFSVAQNIAIYFL